MGHMGGFFYVEEAIRVAKRNSNVYLETSVMPYPEMIRFTAKSIGVEKIFFGSDAPGVNSIVEIQKIIASGLSKKEQENILCKNFLGLISRS